MVGLNDTNPWHGLVRDMLTMNNEDTFLPIAIVCEEFTVLNCMWTGYSPTNCIKPPHIILAAIL